MTNNVKKFGELLSKDESVKKELEAALAGVDKNDKKAFTNAAIKVAAKHGFILTEADFEQETRELSEDEMEAVAGGGCGFGAGFVCTMAGNYDNMFHA